MSSDVDKIKERLGIAEVIGSYIKLQKAGKNLKAVCPFHSEKTPSFFVSPDRDSYYCFGCNARGDIFTFVQEFEGLDFSGALKLLAPKAGVVLKGVGGKNKELEELYSIVEESSLFFEKKLEENKNALDYVKKRGIEDIIVKKFRIGFALDSWDSLITHLKEKGFADKEIERVGLLKKGDKKKLYDTFRNRIIFPIFDSAGRVVAFSGRTLAKKDDYIPKYLNSPETVLFNKSRILYGYDRAKQSMRKSDYCILVEGQVDLVMSHQTGFVNTIALSGTGFTIHHADLIKKITDKMIIAFDGDDAGINSAKRASELALSRGIDVKVANIPLGNDPADIILKDKIQWKNIIGSSLSSVEFFINLVSNNSKDQRDFWKRVRSVVLPLIARIQNKIDKAHFISLTSSKTGIPEESVFEELKKVEEDIKKQTYYQISVEKDNEIDVPFLVSKKRKIIERIKSIILWQKTLNEKSVDINKLLKDTEKLIEERIDIEGEEYISKLIFEAETIFGLFEKEEINKEIDELLKHLEDEILKEKLLDISKRLKELEGEQKNNESTNQKTKKIEVEGLLKQHRDMSLKMQKNKE